MGRPALADARRRGGIVEIVDGVVYLALSLRNVGSGIAVLHGWRIEPVHLDIPNPTSGQLPTIARPDLAEFRPQGRDLYVPAGDVCFWQAAIREPDDPFRVVVVGAFQEGRRIVVDLLYGDHEGGQRTISRFRVTRSSNDDGTWACSVVRRWNLDRHDPR